MKFYRAKYTFIDCDTDKDLNPLKYVVPKDTVIALEEQEPDPEYWEEIELTFGIKASHDEE